MSGGSWNLHANGTVGAPDGVPHPPSALSSSRTAYVDAAATPSGLGYWAVRPTGALVRRGDASALPRTSRIRIRGKAAAIAATPTGKGLVVVGVNGTVSTYGDAPNFGAATALGSPVVDVVMTPSGAGYWMITKSVQVVAFGDAKPFNSPPLAAAKAVEAAATKSGNGMYVVSADGGVFTFGDAAFFGSLAGDVDPLEPITRIQTSGNGYVMLGAWGRAESFAPGVIPPKRQVTPVAPASPAAPAAPSTPKSATPSAVVPAGGASTGAPSAGAGSLIAAGGDWFPGTPALYGTIPANPRLDGNNGGMVSALVGGQHIVNLYDFGLPVYEADASTPRYQVDATSPWGTSAIERQTIPIPDGAVPNEGSDGKMIIVDRSTGLVFDLWQARRSGSGWSASWGGVFPLNGNGSSTDATNRATGSGLSTLFGLVTTEEIANGEINHAMVFSTDIACRSFRAPATMTDGDSGNGNCLPEGARIQLDPSIDLAAIPGISKGELAIGRALQQYGAYVGDRGGARIAIGMQMPTPGTSNPYPAAGFPFDYYNMSKIPWGSLRVLASWNGA